MAAIREIWSNNFHTEILDMDRALRSSAYVAVDTEFPGFIMNTDRMASMNDVYASMKYNIDRLNPVQFGFTLFDTMGNVNGVWQINFCDFDPELTDTERQVSSISLVKRKSRIDFGKQRSQGVLSDVFARSFVVILRNHQERIRWVFFHGNYDLGFLMKLITNSPLPDTSEGFLNIIGGVFKYVYDIKFIAKFFSGLSYGELGLRKISKILGVCRLGKCHQAGSDSLVTAQVFHEMKKKYGFDESLFEGYVYQIDGKIKRTKPQLIRFIPLPFCVPIPSVPILSVPNPSVVYCMPNMVFTPRIDVFVPPPYIFM